jgi:excisionase family DNA binding protein
LLPERAALTVREAARRLKVCTATIYRLCESARLPHLRVGNVIRIRPEALDRLER